MDELKRNLFGIRKWQSFDCIWLCGSIVGKISTLSFWPSKDSGSNLGVVSLFKSWTDSLNKLMLLMCLCLKDKKTVWTHKLLKTKLFQILDVAFLFSITTPKVNLNMPLYSSRLGQRRIASCNLWGVWPRQVQFWWLLHKSWGLFTMIQNLLVLYEHTNIGSKLNNIQLSYAISTVLIWH